MQIGDILRTQLLIIANDGSAITVKQFIREGGDGRERRYEVVMNTQGMELSESNFWFLRNALNSFAKIEE